MFNLLRMDLYRLKRSKSVYVCFASMLAGIFLCYLMIYLLGTPEGQKTAEKIGMLPEQGLEEQSVTNVEIVTMLEEGEELLEGINLLDMFRESYMDGGMYNVLFGLAVALFVCADYKGGAMKNIMSLHRNRWPYIGSKLISAGILNILYLVLGFTFNCLMNLMFGRMVPSVSWSSVLFYLSWVWLVSMAFAAMIIALCALSRSTTVGVLGAVLGGSGLIVVLVSKFMSFFHLDGWMKYTIYYTVLSGPSTYTSPADLRCVALGLIFLVLYTVVAVAALIKQDI